MSDLIERIAAIGHALLNGAHGERKAVGLENIRDYGERISVSLETIKDLTVLTMKVEAGETLEKSEMDWLDYLEGLAKCTHPNKARRRDGSWCPDCGEIFFGKFIESDQE